MTATRYPLAWPDGWHRTPAHQRKRATFGRKETRPGNSWKSHARLTVNDATCRVLAELERLGVVRDDDIIISTMIRVRLDGRPRSGEPEPQDPGVAVYWERPGEPPRCMAIDLYDRVADNLAAVAATLYAMRAIERHGGAAILDRAFTDVQCHPERLEAPLRWKKPRRIFVNSMSDLFHEAVPEDFIWSILVTISNCRRHTFQVLTKRPERMAQIMKVFTDFSFKGEPLPNADVQAAPSGVAPAT